MKLRFDVWLVACFMASLLATGCAVSTRTIEAGDVVSAVDLEALDREVEELLSQPEGRTEEATARAYALAKRAATSTPADDPRWYERLVAPASLVTWLVRHQPEWPSARSELDDSLAFLNTAAAVDEERVEAFYWRAIVLGMIAQRNRTVGRSAMFEIRENANTARGIDPGFDGGGADRLLGALYLRAPGPPVGVGSNRRAIVHLEKSRQIAPDHPMTRLFLAEAYLEVGKGDEAVELLEQVIAAPGASDDPLEATKRIETARDLLVKVREEAQ